MLIRSKKNWELPEGAVTPEGVYRRRREFLKVLGLGLAGSALPASLLRGATSGFPSELNPRYTGLKSSPYEVITSYNNFYEFSTGKTMPKDLANRNWQTEPWTIKISGLVRNPVKMEVNDLVKKIGGIEQRIYRLRCVEAWAMVVPWDGFPLRKLIDLVEPTSEAKYLKLTSFFKPSVAPGQRSTSTIDWPYVEGLTIEEAKNDLALLATGLYGKPMPNQNGAPIRLIVPWKYGFKSIKSITRIQFVKKRPVNTWNAAIPSEYGFYANVNPRVHHPRWSQARERVVESGAKQNTLMFNGYEQEVAALYKGLDLRKNF